MATENREHEAEAATSPRMTAADRAHYIRLMTEFQATVEAHNGSGAAADRCVDALIGVDDHITSLLNGHKTAEDRDTLEAIFYHQASELAPQGPFPETGVIQSLLGTVAHKFNKAMLDLAHTGNLDAQLALLERGGAVVVRHQVGFVKTDPARGGLGPHNPDEEDQGELNRPAPKFAQVITALQSIGIFADQMVIHAGIVVPNTVRDAPYVVIQIPELDKEIAVCDRIGEVILVSGRVEGPHIYALHTKKQLQKAFGMTPLYYRGAWEQKLISHVLGDASPDRAQRQHVDVKEFAKSQSKKSPPLSRRLVLSLMLEAAAVHYDQTGEWMVPNKYTKDPVPGGMPGENWKAINSAATQEHRGLTKIDTLSQIAQAYGLKSGQKINQDALERAVRNWRDDGVLPEEQEILTLSREKVLIAMLEAAALHYDETGEWMVPNQRTTDPVPGMPGENWTAINSTATQENRGLTKIDTLSQIAQAYGLKSGQKINEEALERAVRNWRDHGILPEEQEILTLSREKVLIAMLEAAALHYDETGEWMVPNQYTKTPVPGMPAENWTAINSAASKENRGLTKRDQLARIAQAHGLKKEGGRKINEEALAQAVKDWKENRILPRDKTVPWSAPVWTIIPFPALSFR